MVSGPNWYQMGSKTFYISRVSKYYVEKGYVNRLVNVLRHVNEYFTDKIIMQGGTQGIEMQKDI